jgi:hypothetical protein
MRRRSRLALPRPAGLVQWANVHSVAARKHLDDAAHAGGDAGALAQAEEQLAQAEKRLGEALAYSPSFFDALHAFSQLYIEKAKLASGIVVPSTCAALPPSPLSKHTRKKGTRTRMKTRRLILGAP